MKIEEINQFEKELTWIFAYVPWSNPDAKRKAILWTINFLKDLRKEADGSSLPSGASKVHGLACSFCGKGLTLAITRKRRFCSERCKKRSQRKPLNRPPNRDSLKPQKSPLQVSEIQQLNRDIFRN